jgi:hypothetical protein
MAITQAMCVSFKVDLFGGVHVFGTDTFKLALFTSAAALDVATTTYSAANEASGAGYSAGGAVLTGVSVASSGATAFVDFDDVTWAAASVTARGALLYNASKSNKAVAVLDFGADKTTTGTDFVVQMPAASSTTALLRI